MRSKAAQANRPAQHISGRFVSIGIISRMAVRPVRRTAVRKTPLPEREYHWPTAGITNTLNLRFAFIASFCQLFSLGHRVKNFQNFKTPVFTLASLRGERHYLTP